MNPIKDLGVWFSSNLKFSTHCNHIVKQGWHRLSMVRRTFSSGDVLTLIWAYKVFVRPILEYASPVWSPHLVADIDNIESVQRCFTKSLRGMRDKSYVDRLEILDLQTLECRRLMADLTLTFQILHGLVNFPTECLFTLRVGDRTRGHSRKLVVLKASKDCRKYFLAYQVVNAWNALPGALSFGF